MPNSRFGDKPGRNRLRRFASGTIALLFALHAACAPAAAQTSLRLVRDAEIEQLLRDYARPVLRAAGLDASSVEIAIINDSGFNAFVAGGQRIFINVGALSQSETPNEIIGVLAHEAGHIAGGHLTRLRQQLEQAQLMAVVGMLLGAGAVAGGAAAGMTGGEMTQLGQALAMGGQHAAGRTLLSYQRSEEQAADRAAINYLNATGQSGQGMLTTFRRLSGETMFLTRGTDPYAMSHPMPHERIQALEGLARASAHFAATDSAALQLRHDMARAKIAGFVEGQQAVARRYRDGSLPARYARAIVAYRYGDPRGAITEIDGLIAEQPNNPYFWELKGQALTETARPAEAIAPLRKAVSLAPDAGLIRIALGHALIASGEGGLVDEAIRELSRGLQAEPEYGQGYGHLARAYAMRGDVGQAELATARGLFANGDWDEARQYAGRAQTRLPTGSPGWLQAEDILNYREPR